MGFDVNEDTDKVEQGHGCFLKETMNALPDADARLDFLMAIKAENRERREIDPRLPVLEVSASAREAEADLSIVYKTGLFSYNTLYSEHFLAAFPQHRKITCED